jgi:acetyltransferase-like isoleucine patch superfamily enzyme
MFSLLSHLWCKLTRIARGRSVRRSCIHSDSKVCAGSSLVNSTMGRHSFCGYDCTILNTNIGPFVSIASRVSIGGLAHPAHFVSTSSAFLSHTDSGRTKLAHHDYLPLLKTEIGADVWIGEGAFVKAGVHVGHGAIIGMGAVVTRDVPPYAVVAGNPARLIKYRFSETVVLGLLASRWWDWSDARLHKLGPVMHNPQAFLQQMDLP